MLLALRLDHVSLQGSNWKAKDRYPTHGFERSITQRPVVEQHCSASVYRVERLSRSSQFAHLRRRFVNFVDAVLELGGGERFPTLLACIVSGCVLNVAGRTVDRFHLARLVFFSKAGFGCGFVRESTGLLVGIWPGFYSVGDTDLFGRDLCYDEIRRCLLGVFAIFAGVIADD